MDKTFDEIDNLFLDYFNENKEVPYSIQNTINHALDSEKKQNSLLEFIKALIITLIGIFTVTGGLVFARKMVNHYFNNNVGIDTAVQNGYIESVDSDYVESNNVKLKVKDFMMDDFNLNFNFDIMTDSDISNVNDIIFSDVLITDESHNVLYSDNRDLLVKYCKDNDIEYNEEQYNKQLLNIGCNHCINSKSDNYVDYVYNLYSDNYPLSRRLRIIIGNITLISDCNTSVDGNWEMNITVPEKFYKRESSEYRVTYCSDPSFVVTNARLYDTCMKISFKINISNIAHEKSIIDILSSYVDANTNYDSRKKGLENFNKNLNNDEFSNNLFEEFIKNSITDIHIKNATEYNFYPTTSNDTENSYIISPNGIFHIETFSLTKYDATKKLNLYINYNNKIIEINLEKRER